MSDCLLRSVEDEVAVLTFNRPDAANGWTADLHVEYLDALHELEADDRVRAVVVTGAGRHFCAGADISLLDAVVDGEDLPAELNAESFLQPVHFPKPLIAAVNGSAAGLGLVHALMADLRFAADSAVFVTAFSQRGLVAEHGISWLLPQIIGRARALDMLLSSRRVTAAEAERIGLVHEVHRVDELLPRAIRYARDLARSCSPASIQAMKHQLNRHPVMQLADAEAETVRLVDESLHGADVQEGVQSFLERRPARFAPLGKGTVLPSLTTPPPDPDALASAFFAATSRNDWEAALTLLSPHATVRTHPGPPASGVDGLAETWQKLRDRYGPWEYLDIRRQVAEDSFCEQHVVRFPDLDVRVEACVVGRLDEHGRIVLLEEYVDSAALAEASRHHRPQPETAR